MNQIKVKILVACHKPDTVYSDDVYIPIHVGRAVSKFKEEMTYMIGDDTGDNISKKNPYYCELTAQYWAWKNLDCEYVGLCHYRRYFQDKITENYIKNKVDSGYDIVLVKPIHSKRNLGNRLVDATCLEEVYIFTEVFKKLHPSLYSNFIEHLGCNVLSPYNMFVANKSLFDEFASFQFELLEELEKYILPSNYSRMRRVYGYLSEVLLSFYIKMKGLKPCYLECVNMLGGALIDDNSFFRNSIVDVIYLLSNRSFSFDSINAIRAGLANDGITINS